MRVLDLNTLYIDGGEGGVNTYLREKSRYLTESGLLDGRSARHVIVVPGRRTERTRLEGATLYTIRSPQLPGNPHHRVLIDFPRVRAILREETPHIVEVDVSYLLGHVAATTLPSVPVVGFYHVDLPRLYTRAGRGWLRSRVSQRTESFAWSYARYCARPCSRVIVTTRGMREKLEQKRFRSLEVVPLGVNLDLFHPRGAEAKPGLPGIDPTRHVVLYVGRLGREKDLGVLFAAHRQLSSQVGSQLVIAGDGPLRRQIERFARSCPGVVYAGTCPYGERLAELYRASDVLAVPGRNETFGLIVLEALASGIPVVAADEGGPSELCRSGPGLIARAGNPEDFAAKIRCALGWRCRAAEYRKHVENRFPWSRTFNKLLDVYALTLEKKIPAGEVLAPKPVVQAS